MWMQHDGAPPHYARSGWIKLFGSTFFLCLFQMVNQAMFSVFGLIFGDRLEEMSQGKATGFMLVMSVNVMVTNFSGLAVGPLMRSFPIRIIAICGILCVGSGMIISSFSTAIWHIVIGYGFFTGLGLGLLASVTFLAINNYFTEKKSTAVGLSMTGTSIGQMLMPGFVGWLLSEHGFSGTTLTLGFMSYTGLLGALLFEIPKKEEIKKEPEIKVLLDVPRPKSESNGVISNGIETSYKASVIEFTSSSELANKNSAEPKTTSNFRKIVNSLDLGLLKDFSFVHILSGLSVGYFSTVTFSTIFPMFLEHEAHFLTVKTTACMTALSFADVVGRTTVSEIFRRLKFGNKSAFMTGCILLAICRSCLVSMTDFTWVFAFSLLVGYARAVTVINQNLVISEYVCKERLPSAVGLNMVSKGLVVFGLGQAFGPLKDSLGYSTCIHIMDVTLVLIAISWTLERLVRRTRRPQIQEG
ncbi:hypothetical protein NQ317_012486 [Molorchus minor]|uniref:Uncharacterized protein n=1 Tax=Molorchus minor TaxID=1323400 RepID=A0ABQ9K1C6_9CUCU|nr:hypothetical protein NQ317_012486 [Molorchus minor]